MLSERDLKFFRPLWIRVGLTVLCAAWFVLEVLLSRDQLWIGITAIATAYCVWNFFIKFPKATPETLPAPGPDEKPKA